MSDRRTTSYRLLLLRAALGRLGRTLAYYWVSLRAQLRMWRSSYQITMFGHRARGAAAATRRLLLSVPRRIGGLFGLVAWFLGQLPAYLGRVVADRREDRMELRAERRLIAAQRRAERGVESAGRRSESAGRRTRRRAELAEIKANRAERPNHLPVPAWISRMERPARPERVRRVPAPRRAMLAAALTMAAVVPAYSVVSGVLSSDDLKGAVPDVAAAPGAAAAPGTGPAGPAQPAAPGTPGASPAGPVVASGDTGEFVRTLPPLPTAAPALPAPGLVVPTPTAPAGGAAIVGSLTNPLTEHEAREARRQAKWNAKLARIEAGADQKDPGK